MTMLPTLVIQMQRMGDLIMTFPLIGWLKALEPQRAVWVLAERRFFEGLVALCPEATLFPAESAHLLAREHFHRVINLSHRPEAAEIAGEMDAAETIGPISRGGSTRIRGFWQLYRASIVHNNRHNRFHWADLNGLDVIPPEQVRRTIWPAPDRERDSGRVGLFVGASEAAKRPEPAFWAELAVGLVRRGLRPVFLGGPSERELGHEAATRAGLGGSNLCGSFSLIELAAFFQTLDLVVTPDTGPMHLAAWTGTPTLNLSLGPVSAWETAPAGPGHLVLRSTASCRGCWHCSTPPPRCHAPFEPQRIAALVHMVLRRSGNDETLPDLPGLALLRTERTGEGLFHLTPLHGTPPSHREVVSAFWQRWFMARAGLGIPDSARTAWEAVPQANPRLSAAFTRALAHLGAVFARQLRKGGPPFDVAFWTSPPPMLRPLTGLLHLHLQNEDYSPAAWHTALEQIADVAACTHR